MKVIERVAEYYDVQEVEVSRTYRLCAECVILEFTKCAKKMTLTR
jgi:hypothetical protein